MGLPLSLLLHSDTIIPGLISTNESWYNSLMSKKPPKITIKFYILCRFLDIFIHGFRFGATAVKSSAMNLLSGSPAMFSFAFNVTVNMQVGQANVFPSPSTFSWVANVSRQALQNECEQGKTFGSFMILLQASQTRRF